MTIEEKRRHLDAIQQADDALNKARDNVHSVDWGCRIWDREAEVAEEVAGAMDQLPPDATQQQIAIVSARAVAKAKRRIREGMNSQLAVALCEERDAVAFKNALVVAYRASGGDE